MNIFKYFWSNILLLFSRRHKVEAFIPRQFDQRLTVTDRGHLQKYIEEGIVKECPPKSYDGRFIIEAAIYHDGLIISNDQYRDLILENPIYKDKLKW